MNNRIPIELREEAFTRLNPDERTLFLRLSPGDQRHSLDVYRTTVVEWPNDTYLHVAGLLHDVGKGRPSLFERIAFSLLITFAPWILLRWENKPRNRAIGRIGNLLKHTSDSALLAELAGSHPAVIDAIKSYGFREHKQGCRLAHLDATL